MPVRQGILRAAVLLPAPAAEESAVQLKIAREKKCEAGSSSVRSGYSGPKSAGSGKKSSGRRGSHYRKSARHRKHMIIAAEIVVIILMILGGAFWYMYHRTFGSMQKIDFNEDTG